MKKSIFIAVLIIFSMFFQTFADISHYKNNKDIPKYKAYIEQRAESFFLEKTLFEKIDLLVKVSSLLETYEWKDTLSKSEENIVIFLYALDEYIREDIGEHIEPEKEQITIRVIDDKRCINCHTESIVSQLKVMSFLEGATYVREDFSDSNVREYLEDNGIANLPAVIFDTNTLNDGGQITPFLQILPDGNYSLALGASFDPFEERSERGFKIIDMDTLKEIQDTSYILGDSDAEILWLEYSDLECPFCARLHTSGVLWDLQDEYGNKLQYSLQHFPLSFHENAMNAALALECIWKEDAWAFYDVVEASFEKYDSNNFSLTGFYNIAEKEGINRENLKTCVSERKYKQKVEAQMSVGQNTFHITGTPGNVLINTKTWEYEILWGAYPYENFKQIIDRLLK